MPLLPFRPSEPMAELNKVAPDSPQTTQSLQSILDNPSQDGSASRLEGLPNQDPPSVLRIRNRRHLYLARNPSYFSQHYLELAAPLLYDRLVRQFQTAADREAEGRAKGYSGVLEADLVRAEAKREALAKANNEESQAGTIEDVDRATGSNCLPRGLGEPWTPETREEGQAMWRKEMEIRFLQGRDQEFDYSLVDYSDEWDDWDEETRNAQEQYFDEEEPKWILGDGEEVQPEAPRGETGIQDF